MSELNKNRFRNRAISIRVSPEESAQIEARIKVTGMQKSEYYINTFLQQQINITVGKYQSDRLSLEFKRLRECIEKLDVSDEVRLSSLLLDCKALLSELKPLMERSANVEEKLKFEPFKNVTEGKEETP